MVPHRGGVQYRNMIDDPLSLIVAGIWLMAAGMYPLGFLFGACSPCCKDQGCCGGSGEDNWTQAVVTISGFADNSVNGSYESCKLGLIRNQLPEAIRSAVTFSWSSCSLLNTTHIVDIPEAGVGALTESATIPCSITMRPYDAVIPSGTGGGISAISGALLESQMNSRYGSLTQPRQTSAITTVSAACSDGNVNVSVAIRYADAESVFGWPCRMQTQVRSRRFGSFAVSASNPIDDSCESIASRQFIVSNGQPYFMNWPCTAEQFSTYDLLAGCPIPNPNRDLGCSPNLDVFYYESGTYCQRNHVTDNIYVAVLNQECLNVNPRANLTEFQTYDRERFIFGNLRGIAFTTRTTPEPPPPQSSLAPGNYKYIPSSVQTIIGGRARPSHGWTFSGCESGMAVGAGVIPAGQTEGVVNRAGELRFLNPGGVQSHDAFDLSHVLSLTWGGSGNHYFNNLSGYNALGGDSLSNIVFAIYDLKLGCDASNASVMVELQP